MKYFSISKASMLQMLVYRSHTVMVSISNVIYVFLIYYLWLAIYQEVGKDEINGASLNSTVLTVAVSATLIALFNTWPQFKMSSDIYSGNIVVLLTKPVDYHFYRFWDSVGFTLINFLWVPIPIIFFVIFYIDNFGILYGNLSVFFLMIILSYIIYFNIDFIIGVLSFYTHSIWGINVSKEIILMFLSGAVIPLGFFPEKMIYILSYTPFPSLFSNPISVLISPEAYNPSLVISMIINQLFWLVVTFLFGRLLFRSALKGLIVNGG